MPRREPITRSLNVGHLGRAVGRWIILLSVCVLGQPKRLCAQPLQLDLTVERTPRAMDCAAQSELRAKVDRLTQHTLDGTNAKVERRSQRNYDGTTASQRNYDGTTANQRNYDGTTANQRNYDGTTANQRNYDGTAVAPAEIEAAVARSASPGLGDARASRGTAPRQPGVAGSEPMAPNGSTSGKSNAVSGADLLRVLARFDKTGSEYLADVQFTGAKPGERRLSDRGRDCTSLEEAVAVAIALLLDRENQHREQTSKAAQRAVPTIQISRGRFALQPARYPSHEWFVAAKFGPIWDTTDAPSIAVALGVGVVWKKQWQLELGASHVTPKTTGYGPGEVTVSLLAAEARGCRHWGRSLLVGACATSTLGRLRGKGRGFDESGVANLFWSAVGGSLLIQRELGSHGSVGIEATAWRPLSASSFRIENAGTAWNSSAIWAALALRLGVRFP